MAVGTVVVTESRVGSIKRVKFAWTSGTGAEGGTASGTTTNAYNGKVEVLTTDPGATAPTDDYDIAVLDADGIDVLAGAGVNRDTANTEQVLAALVGVVVNSTLTLNITNAGDAKVGVVYVDIR